MQRWMRLSLMMFLLIAITPFPGSANVFGPIFVAVSSFVTGLGTIATQIPKLYDSVMYVLDDRQRRSFYHQVKNLGQQLYDLENLRDAYLDAYQNGEDVEEKQTKFVKKIQKVEKSFNDMGAEIARHTNEEEVIKVGFDYQSTEDTPSREGYGVASDLTNRQDTAIENEKCKKALHNARLVVDKVLAQLEEDAKVEAD